MRNALLLYSSIKHFVFCCRVSSLSLSLLVIMATTNNQSSEKQTPTSSFSFSMSRILEENAIKELPITTSSGENETSSTSSQALWAAVGFPPDYQESFRLPVLPSRHGIIPWMHPIFMQTLTNGNNKLCIVRRLSVCMHLFILKL